MAEVVISENKAYLGGDLANEAIEEIQNSEEGGETTDEKAKRFT